MVSQLLRSEIAPRNAPHDWNSWDHYRTIHDIRLSDHPFVVSFRDTLVFSTEEQGVIRLRGYIFCQNNVILRVRISLETRWFGQTLRVRPRLFSFLGWLPSQHLLLKYHNLHRDRREYHHRVYNPAMGDEILHEVLERYQFPTLPKVLDELQILAQDL